MADRRVDRRQLLAGAGVAGIAALGSVNLAHAASSKEKSGLIGTWLGTFTTSEAGQTPFGQLLTFIPGGTVVGSGSYDLVPPDITGPQYGVWSHVGGDRYRMKLLAFAVGDGKPAGLLTGRFTFTLQSGQSLSGSGTISLTDPSGTTQQVGTMTFQMTRQTAL